MQHVNIRNPHLLELLDRAKEGDPAAPGRLLGWATSQLHTLRTTALFPRYEDDPSAWEEGAFELNVMWKDVADDISDAAEDLWRSNFTQDESPVMSRRRLDGRTSEGRLQQAVLRRLTRYSKMLLRVSVEARLYRARAIANFEFGRFDVEARKGGLGPIRRVVAESMSL